MKKFKKISTILFLSTYLVISLSFTSPTLAADAVNFTPQISIPGSEFQQGVSTTVGSISSTTVTSDLLARYIKAFYSWGLSIVGVLAVLMLMAGGLIWLTSAGDSGKVESAKKMISGSLFGTLLLVGAYFFLNTINPDLNKLPVIKMDVIQKIEAGSGCCDVDKTFGWAAMTTSSNCKSGFSLDKVLNPTTFKCEEKICCVNDYNNGQRDISYCFDTFKTNCTGTGKGTAGSCINIAKCNDSILSCAGVNNGYYAKTNIAALSQVFHCYDGNVYSGLGKYNEPCGTYSKYPGYGYCVKKTDECFDENNIGGRFCDSDSNLKCCLKESKTGGASGKW